MRVSVVMATRNRQKLLPAAVNSVRMQTHQDFELVVVDDGSTDSTPDLLERFAREDNRIIELRQAHSGVSAARNLALARSGCEIVAMMDDDDLMRPERLARQIKYLCANPDKCAVFSHAQIIDENDAVIGESTPSVDFERARRLRRPDLALDVIHGTVMLHKKAVVASGGYRLPKLEDRDLFGRLWTQGFSVGMIPEFLYAVRRHGSNVSRDRSEETLMFGDFVDFNALRRLDGLPEIGFEAYCRDLRLAPLPQRFQRYVRRNARFAYDLATLRYSERRMLGAFGYALAAFSLSPSRTARKVSQKIVWRA